MDIINPSENNKALYKYNYTSNKIKSVDAEGVDVELDEFELDYRVPTFQVEDLKKIQNQDDSYWTEDLQLPPYLPDRIRELTVSLTQDKDNRYDKVKAVENYFDRPEFEYDRIDIPYPEDGQDFVDQFLFETKRGYCDHFSTSMVIMLRTIGIPARWAKGYTEGEYASSEKSRKVYKVTNNNAHSWVEVFFEGVGWVPFEPTKGFTNNARFEFKPTTTSSGTDSKKNSDTPKKPTQTPNKQKELEEQQSSGKAPITITHVKNKVIQNWKKNAGTLAGVLAFVGLLYLIRGKWLPYVWIWYFKRHSSKDTFIKAYHVLNKQLKRMGLKKHKGQTLREFANNVDEHFNNDDMSQLTKHYEKVIYGNADALESWSGAKELWEKVMKKTIT